MPTLKEVMEKARTGKLSPEQQEILIGEISSGVYDALAEQEGVDLSGIKSAIGKTTARTGVVGKAPEVKEPTKAEAYAEKVLEEPSIIEEIVEGEAHGIVEMQKGVEGIKETVTEGIAEDGLLGHIPEEVEEKGLVKGVLSGAKKNLQMSLGEYVPELGKDILNITGGAFETIFTIPMVLAEEIPGVEPAFEKLSELAVGASGQILDAVAPEMTEGQKQAAVQGMSNLMIMGALSVGGKGVSRGLEKGAKKAKGAAEVVYESAVKPSTREAEVMQNYDAAVKLAENDIVAAKRAKDTVALEESTGRLKQLEESKPVTVAETAAKKSVSGREKTVGVEARVEKAKLWRDQIDPALKGSKETIKKADVFKKLEEYVETQAEPGRKADLEKALETMKEDYAKYEEFTLEEAQNIKSGLDEFTPNKYWKGQDIASSYKQMKAEMADALRNAIYEKLPDFDIKTAYRDWANLKSLEKVGIKGRTLGGLKGGSGTFVSTIWDLATIPIKTTAGKYLYKAGELLEFVSGKRDIKTLGEYLESEGIPKSFVEKILIPGVVAENTTGQQTGQAE